MIKLGSMIAPLVVLAACQSTQSSMSDNAASRTQFHTLRKSGGKLSKAVMDESLHEDVRTAVRFVQLGNF